MPWLGIANALFRHLKCLSPTSPILPHVKIPLPAKPSQTSQNALFILSNRPKPVLIHANSPKSRKKPPEYFARIPKVPTFALAFRKGGSHNDRKRDHRQTANRQKNKTMSISVRGASLADKLKSRFHPYKRNKAKMKQESLAGQTETK